MVFQWSHAKAAPYKKGLVFGIIVLFQVRSKEEGRQKNEGKR
jgi:hypothetical protein